MNIRKFINDRGIVELLHFTTNRGLVGVLAKKALLSRFELPKEKYLESVLHVNAAIRPESSAFFDKSQNWLDYVNLSISEINARYFQVSKRWHINSDVWWCILAFDSRIMTHDGVEFATTNNSYDRCVRQGGVDGLEALFAPCIQRKAAWSVVRGLRQPCLPTCEQAEVLYPKAVSTDFLRRIYVREDDHHDQASGWLREFGFRDVDVVLSPQKFIGKPN